MNKVEIEQILQQCLERETIPWDVPTQVEWNALRHQFKTDFPNEFMDFINCMAHYAFPGDILNVPSEGRTNGNDTMTTAYEFERSSGQWPVTLLPFYAIGNGDYFALNVAEGRDSSVYYVYHDDGQVKRHAASFAIWIAELPAFLSS